ncbi:hypothetical protein [Nocardia nova]|nr:hypothetical protein [Nocardia nova]
MLQSRAVGGPALQVRGSLGGQLAAVGREEALVEVDLRHIQLCLGF